MFEKRSLIFVSATFLCTSIIIGSGFSLWIFNEDFIKEKLTSSQVTLLKAHAENGELKIKYHSGYTNYNLILEQQDSKFSVSDSGVYFTPSILLEYSNYYLPDNCIATITGTVTIENKALAQYIEVIRPLLSDNGAFCYTFVESILDCSSGEPVYFETVPLFKYRDNMAPQTSTQFGTMINSINNSYDNSGYLGSISIDFSVDITEEEVG